MSPEKNPEEFIASEVRLSEADAEWDRALGGVISLFVVISVTIIFGGFIAFCYYHAH